jgi:hypothetical protein
MDKRSTFVSIERGLASVRHAGEEERRFPAIALSGTLHREYRLRSPSLPYVGVGLGK